MADEIIIISQDELPPEQPADIVINPEDLLPESNPVTPHVAADFVIELPDVPCAICHQPINPDELFGKCNICSTPYHKNCWDYNGGCAVLGCSGNRNRGAFQSVKSL